MSLTAANMTQLTDDLGAHYIRLRGVTGQAYGLGNSADTERAYDKAVDFYDHIVAIGGQVNALGAQIAYDQLALNDIEDRGYALHVSPSFALLKALAAAAGLTGINSLDSFASYYNTGTGAPWNCLLSPYFRLAYYSVLKAFPTNTNVYFQCKQGETFEGTTFTNALRKAVVTGAGTDTETAGYDIDEDDYAGGVGKVTMSGITGTGTVTIAGTWRKPDGTTETGNGTANVTANGTFTLTPPTANDLLLLCTSITIPAGISAGTLYVETYAPAGRSHPPA